MGHNWNRVLLLIPVRVAAVVATQLERTHPAIPKPMAMRFRSRPYHTAQALPAAAESSSAKDTRGRFGGGGSISPDPGAVPGAAASPASPRAQFPAAAAALPPSGAASLYLRVEAAKRTSTPGTSSAGSFWEVGSSPRMGGDAGRICPPEQEQGKEGKGGLRCTAAEACGPTPDPASPRRALRLCQSQGGIPLATRYKARQHRRP